MTDLSTPALPAADWYPDPLDERSERWWDGSEWTHDVRSAYAAPVWRRGAFDGAPANFGQAIIDGFAGYFRSRGMSSRSAYWWRRLFYFLVWLLATIVNVSVFVALDPSLRSGPIPLLPYISVCAIALPSLTVQVRRLRDAGLHWAWIFIELIPLGLIVVIVMSCQPGAAVIARRVWSQEQAAVAQQTPAGAS